MSWKKISGLALVATAGVYAPAAMHAQASAAQGSAAPAGAAPTRATDSLITAEQLTHYVALKRALSTYYSAHQDLLQTARANAQHFVVSLPSGDLPVGAFDYPALVKQDTALAAIFRNNQFLPTQFAPMQVSVSAALNSMANHASQGTALPEAATVRGKNIPIVYQSLMDLSAAGVTVPAPSAPSCPDASATGAANGASAVALQGGSMAGIPMDRPNDVTVLPFFTKPNETDLEKTKAVIEADIDGHHGVFIFDLGAGTAILNRTVLQPNAKGGVDTVTDANRIPDNTPRGDYVTSEDDERQMDHVHVTVKLGTLVSNYDDPTLTAFMNEKDPHRYNAELGHLWGNFGWVFGPRLGNLGPAVFQPFETIVDYVRRQVVLIRLDSAGNRLVDVPAYPQRMHMPLPTVAMGSGFSALQLAVDPCNSLDTKDPTRNLWFQMLDTGAPTDGGGILGYPFLSGLGVFGVNQRTHQFILYGKGA